MWLGKSLLNMDLLNQWVEEVLSSLPVTGRYVRVPVRTLSVRVPVRCLSVRVPR